MATKRDLYEVLGVKKNATKDEIKSAYRKLAKMYHPDNKETGDEAKFKEIQEAYDILYDDQKRAAYDQFGFAAFEQAGGNPGGNPFDSDFSGYSDGGSIFDDVINSFFGGGSRRTSGQRTGPRRGNDRIIQMNIDFMEAIKGGTYSINLTVDETCPKCNGTGAKDSNSIRTCGQCNGRGYVRYQRRSIFGVVESQEACPACNGAGKVIVDRCPECGGKGYTRKKKDIDVQVYAGINTGQQIIVRGYGERGINGGSNGDLVVEVNVKPHSFFKREGNDIHITLPIDYIDCALGIKVNIPTVYGEVELNIPAGTQPSSILKLKGQGVKDGRSGRSGDQYVHLKLAVPNNLSSQQKKILQELRTATPKSETLAYLEKIKNSLKN